MGTQAAHCSPIRSSSSIANRTHGLASKPSRHHCKTRHPGTADAANRHARAGLRERNGPTLTRGARATRPATSQHRVGRRWRGSDGRRRTSDLAFAREPRGRARRDHTSTRTTKRGTHLRFCGPLMWVGAPSVSGWGLVCVSQAILSRICTARGQIAVARSSEIFPRALGTIVSYGAWCESAAHPNSRSFTFAK